MTDSAHVVDVLCTRVWEWEQQGFEPPVQNVEAIRAVHELIRSVERGLDVSVLLWRVEREEVQDAQGLAVVAADAAITALAGDH